MHVHTYNSALMHTYIYTYTHMHTPNNQAEVLQQLSRQISPNLSACTAAINTTVAAFAAVAARKGITLLYAEIQGGAVWGTPVDDRRRYPMEVFEMEQVICVCVCVCVCLCVVGTHVYRCVYLLVFVCMHMRLL